MLHRLDFSMRFLITRILELAICLLVSYLMGKLEGRTIADYGLPLHRMFRSNFWVGTLAGFAAITLLLAALHLAGVFSFGSMVLNAQSFMYAVLYGCGFFIFALREEFYYRGYALFTLATGIGFWPAALCSSLYFAYDHLHNSGEALSGIVQAGCFGVIACLMLRRTGNLLMAVGFHAAWDWGQTYFYGVPDSGVTVPGHLFSPSTSGAAWLTGGSVGPEGSVLCTVVLGTVGLIILGSLRENKYPDPVAVMHPRAR